MKNNKDVAKQADEISCHIFGASDQEKFFKK